MQDYKVAISVNNDSFYCSDLPLSHRSSLRASASASTPLSPSKLFLHTVILRNPDILSKSGTRYRRLSCQARLCFFVA